MSDWSEEDPVRMSGGADVAVPMGILSDVSAAVGDSPGYGADPSDPVMFRILDARRGQVSIVHGTNQVLVRDPQLVSRIRAAARAARTVG